MSLNARRATQRKSGEVSDSLESGQTEGGLIRVDWSSDSSIVEVPEGAQEQCRHMAPKQRVERTRRETVKRFIEDLILAPSRRPLRPSARNRNVLASSCKFLLMASSRLKRLEQGRATI